MKDINDICFIIQARLSSERVPRKMMKNFAGTSLVDIACKKINESKVIPSENFYFSAYENEIKEVVINNNLQLFHRSKVSAFSEGPMQEVMEYHDKLNYKYSVVISACCPLLTIDIIDDFVKSYINSPHDGMFSVIAKKNYFWDEDFNMITEWPEESDVLNTKLVGVTYEAAHCLYAGKLDTIKDGMWMAKPPFVKNSPALFVVPEYETFDIDYNWQFEVAESLYKQKNSR
mgnify:CR=1 FL=1